SGGRAVLRCVGHRTSSRMKVKDEKRRLAFCILFILHHSSFIVSLTAFPAKSCRPSKRAFAAVEFAALRGRRRFAARLRPASVLARREQPEWRVPSDIW